MKKTLLIFASIFAAAALAGLPSTGGAQTAENDFQGAISRLRQSRQDFKSEKIREASEAAEIGKAKSQAQRKAAEQRREEARKRMEDQRKEILLKLADIQIKWMNRIKERAQAMPNITDELKNQLTAEIDAAVQNLNDKKAEIEAALEEDAIKALAREVRDLFKSKQEIVKKIVDAIHASRADIAVAKAEDRLAAVKEKIEEMREEGKDTSEVETESEGAEEDIALAQEAIGRRAFKEASENLKAAYQKFRNIAEKAKGL